MNKATLDYLMDRMDRRRDNRDMRDMRDSEDGRRRRSRDYEDGYEDGRRSRRTGRYIRDRRDMRNEEDFEGRGNVDFEGSMDFNDGHMPYLNKTDIHRWKQMLENDDGSKGPHYDMQQVMSIAEKMGIDFEKGDFDEKEFCMTVNMFYSDYCKVANKYVAPDKELAFFADMAKKFLCDKDGPDPSEKLALYFHCIVDG